MTLPVKIAKRIAGECCYGGCSDPALDDSDFCGPHDAHERGRDANKKRRRRQRLAEGGLCTAGCGRKVARQRKPDGSVRQRECSACRRAHVQRSRDARAKACVPGDGGAVPGSGQWRTEVDKRPGREGQTTQRWVGKSRRGRLTRTESLDELKRNLVFARKGLDSALRSLDVLKTSDVQDLPPVQREAAYREPADELAHNARLIDEVVDALRGK